MKTLRYEVDFETMKLSPQELVEIKKNPTHQKDIFESNVYFMSGKKHPSGISGSDQRCIVRILNKLDATTDGTIQLEDAEHEFLKSIFNSEVPIPCDRVRLISVYREKVDTAQ